MPNVNLSSLGRKIRAARVARRLTLEDVVSQTEFTVSWLSKIENGLLAPSLEGLVRLAEALDCGVEDLVSGLLTPPRLVVDRAGDGRIVTGRNGSTGVNTHPLSESWRGRAMQPEILEITGAGGRRPAESRDGERFLHVLAGEIKVTYGEEIVRLGPGDSLYLDASIPHSLAAAGRGAARVLSVIHEPASDGKAANAGRRRPGRPAAAARA
ncbi:MAG: hypothetical protein RLZZ440_952 [Planctomycetota bacterium]|jgi:transcriptional regulator with XRE-family HTH domain